MNREESAITQAIWGVVDPSVSETVRSPTPDWSAGGLSPVIDAVRVAMPLERTSFAPYSDRPLMASENADSGRYASTLLICSAKVIAPG
jgi:hypothetical protein